MLTSCRLTLCYTVTGSVILVLLAMPGGCGDAFGTRLREKQATIEGLQNILASQRRGGFQSDCQRQEHKAYQAALEAVKAHPAKQPFRPRPFFAAYNDSIEIGKDVPPRRLSVMAVGRSPQIRGIFFRHNTKVWEYPVIDPQAEWYEEWRRSHGNWVRFLPMFVLRENVETLDQYSDATPEHPHLVLAGDVMKYLSGDDGDSLEIGLLLEGGGRSATIPVVSCNGSAQMNQGR